MITDAPPELVDDIWFRPGIWPNCRSSGAVTDEVITSGLAPGYSVTTWMVGIVDLGQRRERQQTIGDDAREKDRHHQQRGRHRPQDE